MKFLYSLLPLIYGALSIGAFVLLLIVIGSVVDKIKNRREKEEKDRKETSPDYIKDILSYCLSKNVDTKYFTEEELDELNRKNVLWLEKLESEGERLMNLAQLSDKTKSTRSYNVFPGEGTDRIKYGMDVKTLLEELLLPNRIYYSNRNDYSKSIMKKTESIYLTFYDLGLEICLNENSEVVHISLRSNIQYGNPEYGRDYYKFQKCKAIYNEKDLFDMSYEQIEFLFGEPQNVRKHDWPNTIPYTTISYKNGLSFDFRNDSKQITLIRI